MSFLDWIDGRALAFLIDSFKNGILGDYKDMDPKAAVENCRTCMSKAESVLGIPMIITPEEFSHPETDELSVITYLSYFMELGKKELLVWLQSALPEHNISNLTTDWITGIPLAHLVDACSPGVHGDMKSLHPRLAPTNIARSLEYAETGKHMHHHMYSYLPVC